MSANKIIARSGPAKGKGDIIVTTRSGGPGSSTVQFRAYHETIGPLKESAVWIEESPMQSLAWGRRSLAPTSYTQEDPLGLSIEGNDNKKFPDDLRDVFPNKWVVNIPSLSLFLPLISSLCLSDAEIYRRKTSLLDGFFSRTTTAHPLRT